MQTLLEGTEWHLTQTVEQEKCSILKADEEIRRSWLKDVLWLRNTLLKEQGAITVQKDRDVSWDCGDFIHNLGLNF